MGQPERSSLSHVKVTKEPEYHHCNAQSINLRNCFQLTFVSINTLLHNIRFLFNSISEAEDELKIIRNEDEAENFLFLFCI